ncbi:MAG: molybdopterin-dependent oxidoreductase [Leptolyngbyaceae cyanobacterium SU_3_3]|nr:molybdopterin-dependent oxidoreductase [Leptolyngbyaceae cyanobacterium SU_3_3]NJR48665.1 molybdopterin-dependent oxidoreductase [Leptolyngbyaceae cyanobacterium CSU_1_3]
MGEDSLQKCITVNRRQLLKQLLGTSGGLIAASFLSGCQSKAIDPLFLLNLLNPDDRLPDHILTPLSEFYVQSYALPSRVNAETWQLKFTGAVKQPLVLSFQDILQAPQEEFYLTMECIGNPTGGNLIGNAQWMGTPLLPFLQKAGITEGTIEFALKGADYYETTLPVAEVMRPDVRLVHKMNQEPLTAAHGFPVRILVPGHFGQKQPKWLIEIEALTKTKRGFWEHQGWSNTAEIPTHSLIRQVQETRVWNRHHQVSLSRDGETGWQQGVLIAGVALDRSAPMRSIQVSTDDGKTWETADQNHPPSPHEWTLWRYRWQPKQPGKYTLLARAQSERSQQPLDDRDGKDGSSGILKIQVTLQI